ncbi:hypothetical protein LCGC14_2430030 [marine sediment metagenome]|uniref:Uncharacterized protein n=1 Tax=marine sediment metagenome TaxID=412755 RepID=A0A0F9BMC7_9ZZZZ
MEIIYDGFLGVELLYLRIPTIVCANGVFSLIKGGNYIIKIKQEFFYYLDNFEKSIEGFHRNSKDRMKEIIVIC